MGFDLQAAQGVLKGVDCQVAKSHGSLQPLDLGQQFWDVSAGVGNEHRISYEHARKQESACYHLVLRLTLGLPLAGSAFVVCLPSPASPYVGSLIKGSVRVTVYFPRTIRCLLAPLPNLGQFCVGQWFAHPLILFR